MRKEDILEIDKINELTLLNSFPSNELLWVQIPEGKTYRVNTINHYHAASNLYGYEIITATYFEPHTSYIIPNEVIINGDSLSFNLETGILLQEKNLLDAVFNLKQIELSKEY